ncbi:hypothetical protein SATMO3_46290 [Sporomusa aerivorans]
MKYVPACEYNPYEAVKTNIISTQNAIVAAFNAVVIKETTNKLSINADYIEIQEGA